MTINVHPIFVHFPVALLTLYPLVEIARFKQLKGKPWVVPLKAFLVIVGTLGAVAAGITGKLATEGLPPSKLTEVHSTFAQLSFALGAVLSFGYAVILVRPTGWSFSRLFRATWADRAWEWLGKVAKWIVDPRVAIPGSIVLLGLITITGALGGAIAYGPDIDPVVAFVYRVFVGS